MRPAAKRLLRILSLAGGVAVASVLASVWITESDPGWASAALVVSRVAASWIFRLDRVNWRDLAFRDAVTAALAFAGGSALGAAACATLPGPWPARLLAADLAIYPCLAFGLAGSLALQRLGTLERTAQATRTVIWGAGADGRALLACIRRHHAEIDVLGWLDDDPALVELDLDGVPVLGPLESLPLLAELHRVCAVAVAIPNLSLERRSRAEELALWSGAKLVFFPGVGASLQTIQPAYTPTAIGCERAPGRG